MRRCQRRQTGELKTFAGLQLGNLAFETGRIITKTVAFVIGNVPAFAHQLNTLGRIVFNTEIITPQKLLRRSVFLDQTRLGRNYDIIAGSNNRLLLFKHHLHPVCN